MSWKRNHLGNLPGTISWVADSNATYQGITTVTHTEGATVWQTNISGKPRWRIWMGGQSYLTQTFATEDEAKRYVEAMLPFVELGALK